MPERARTRVAYPFPNNPFSHNMILPFTQIDAGSVLAGNQISRVHERAFVNLNRLIEL